MTEDTAEKIVEAFEQHSNRLKTAKATGENEVYVSLKDSSHPLVGMDMLCMIAFDYGWVPCGIIRSGAARFKPRDADEPITRAPQ